MKKVGGSALAIFIVTGYCIAVLASLRLLQLRGVGVGLRGVPTTRLLPLSPPIPRAVLRHRLPAQGDKPRFWGAR